MADNNNPDHLVCRSYSSNTVRLWESAR